MRFATWNLWRQSGPWGARRFVILDVLRELDADVVGLQEVPSDTTECFAETLARDLGLHWWWSPAPRRSRPTEESPRSYAAAVGNAVLSRFPGSITDIAHLADGGTSAVGATALVVRLDTAEGNIHFCTTHLYPAVAGSAIRYAQVDQLAALAALHSIPGPMPFVLTGDFNAEPDSDEMRSLGGCLTEPAYPGQVFVDAWRYRDDGDPGLTWNRANPYVLQSGTPSARVDYVLLGLPLGHRMPPVLDVRVFGDQPRRGIWPSDHYGVVVDLRVDNGQVASSEPSPRV